jgi:hypothetical protein
MSSIAQDDSSIANHEHPDPVASPKPNYAGLNVSAVNSEIRPLSIASRLANLIEEHDDLEQAITSMLSDPECNDRVISRFKKRKWDIKGEISTLELICTA